MCRLALYVLGIVAFLSLTGVAKRRHWSDDDDDDENDGHHHNICIHCRVTDRNCTRTVYYPCRENNDDSSEEEEDDHDRRRRSWHEWANRFRPNRRRVRWCQKDVMFICRTYKCSHVCCEGWKYNPATRTCNIKITEKPDIECQNGGTPIHGRTGPECSCPTGYIGSSCEELECKLDCENNGMCDVVRGRSRCTCPRGFNGTLCEIPQCAGGCQNGGSCVVEEDRPICECRAGFTGRSCETALPSGTVQEKDGECPPLRRHSDAGLCVESCSSDLGCVGNEKCCFNGCGHTCSKPVNLTCRYNDRDYALGAVFRPSPCNVCTCLSPNSSLPYGGARCERLQCPALENCKDKKREPGTCCETCADPTPDVKAYKDPKFINCPDHLLVLDVPKDNNQARMSLLLKAADYKGNNLPVNVSKTVFQAGLGEENFHTVMATSARDVRGNFALCQFQIRVRDSHPPTFVTCPTDIDRQGAGPVYWQVPRATDNVGLLTTPRSTYKPGDNFPKGEYPIVYKVEDLEGNTARCEFFIYVSQDAGKVSGGMPTPEPHKGKTVKFIAIGASVGAVVLVFIVVLACCCCKKRAAAASAEEGQAPGAVVFAVMKKGMDDELQPPPAYEEYEPPPYETAALYEIKHPGEKLQFDNPTYQSQNEMNDDIVK